MKQAIFGGNSAKMYRYDIKKAAWRDDRFTAIKTQYERSGRDPSNLRYGYVAPLPEVRESRAALAEGASEKSCQL